MKTLRTTYKTLRKLPFGFEDASDGRPEAKAGEDAGQPGKPRREEAKQDKGDGNGGVKPHVAHDVEVTAEGRGSLVTGDRAVEPIDQPVQQNDQERHVVAPPGQQRNDGEADGEAGDAEGIGRHVAPGEPGASAVERWIDPSPQERIEHRRLASLARRRTRIDGTQVHDVRP